MAREGSSGSIVEAQYRNLAIATEIIAAKGRSETNSDVQQPDPKELVSTSGAVPQNGSLVALVEVKATMTFPTKHSDHLPSQTPFQSWLDKVPVAPSPSLRPTLPRQISNCQEWVDLLLRTDPMHNLSLDYLEISSRIPLEGETTAMQHIETRTIPVVRFPDSSSFIPPSDLEIYSRTSLDEESCVFQDGETGGIPIVKFPNCASYTRPSYLEIPSRTSVQNEIAVFRDNKTGTLPVVKLPSGSCPAPPRSPPPSLHLSAVPVSSYSKPPAFTFYDLTPDSKPSEYRATSVHIKTFEMEDAHVVDLPPLRELWRRRWSGADIIFAELQEAASTHLHQRRCLRATNLTVMR